MAVNEHIKDKAAAKVAHGDDIHHRLPTVHKPQGTVVQRDVHIRATRRAIEHGHAAPSRSVRKG